MDTNPSISVIVPAYDESCATLNALHDSLATQTFVNFEVIVVDDHSSSPDYSCLTDSRFSVIYKETNSGPAATRNAGVRYARAPVLYFTDADCRLHPDTLERVHEHMAGELICMGNTVTDARTFMGRAIGYLGFPGGGLLGFHNVWPINEFNYTTSITSCNLAMATEAFHSLGGFDESFPVAAGEDTMLARKAEQEGLRIRYVPEQIIFHAERARLTDFMRWQVVRGRGAYHVKRRVGRIGGYVGRRFRSFGTSLHHAGPIYAPVVTALFFLSLLCQLYGFGNEAMRDSRRVAAK